MKNLLNIGFVFVLLVQPLFGIETASSEEQESITFSALELKEKTQLMSGDVCDIQVIKQTLIVGYVISQDNNLYIKFSGDDIFLKGIHVVVSNDGIKIEEGSQPSFKDKMQELKTRRTGTIDGNSDGGDFSPKYEDVPKVTIYAPEKCFKRYQRTR